MYQAKFTEKSSGVHRGWVGGGCDGGPNLYQAKSAIISFW